MKNRFELSSIFSTNGVSENANQVFGRKYLKLLHLMCYLCVRTSVTHVPGLYTLLKKGEGSSWSEFKVIKNLLCTIISDKSPLSL